MSYTTHFRTITVSNSFCDILKEIPLLKCISCPERPNVDYDVYQLNDFKETPD